MNIITKFGLVSVVLGMDQGESKYAVRSSNPEAIANFTNKTVIETPEADYQYRVYLTREEFDSFLEQQTNTVDYSNFKNSIEDDNVHKLVYEVWLSRNRLYPGKYWADIAKSASPLR